MKFSVLSRACACERETAEISWNNGSFDRQCDDNSGVMWVLSHARNRDLIPWKFKRLGSGKSGRRLREATLAKETPGNQEFT
jgi:hypothetical protein